MKGELLHMRSDSLAIGENFECKHLGEFDVIFRKVLENYSMGLGELNQQLKNVATQSL